MRRQAYGYAPNGQISWTNREPDGTYPDGSIVPGSAASGSILENNRGDVFDYWADGSLHYGARDVAATNDWPGKFSSTADSRVPDAQVSYAGATTSTYGFGYGYDAAGNRYQADQMNQTRILYRENGLGENQYQGSSYDANGNTTNSLVGFTYQYNANNELIGVSDYSGNLVATFYYDGLGRLIAQNVSGKVTYYYFAGNQRIEERDANNGVRYLYFFEAPGSDHILWREGVDASSSNVWRRLWYLTDLMGNTTHVADDAGNVVEQYLYDPYGTPTVYDPQGRPLVDGVITCDNRYLFKGNGAYEWFPQFSLYYCRARFYLPQHGRFLQPDPIGQAGGLNLYAYCGNDPVNSIDPSGLATDDNLQTHLPLRGTLSTPTGSNIPNYGRVVDGLYNVTSPAGSTGYQGFGAGSLVIGRVDESQGDRSYNNAGNLAMNYTTDPLTETAERVVVEGKKLEDTRILQTNASGCLAAVLAGFISATNHTTVTPVQVENFIDAHRIANKQPKVNWTDTVGTAGAGANYQDAYSALQNWKINPQYIPANKASIAQYGPVQPSILLLTFPGGGHAMMGIGFNSNTQTFRVADPSYLTQWWSPVGGPNYPGATLKAIVIQKGP